eukprot:TRINITY_DN14871_c0_g1_i1.p2 TRINITY_DN14871_c0_g1~~TRINITY_DN14871_c0_g1_i1.p2  ORF type:complete len:136 (+),score=44.55 TRINITY_DN14871_c0_g1_i1:92-499(+)
MLRSLVGSEMCIRDRNIQTMSAPRTFTAEELAPFDGSEGKPLYLSVMGVVFDVSAGGDFYGPGKAYGVFAGKEVSRCLGKMDISDKESNAGWRNLNEEHMKVLQDWKNRYDTKYPVVGTFQPDPHFEMRGVQLDP